MVAAARYCSLVGALACLCATVTATSAAASPLEEPIASSGVFTGPTRAHASSIFLSPAGMAFSGKGQHFYVGGSLRLNTFDIARRTIDPETGALSNGASASPLTLAPGGLAAFYASVGDRYHVGVSIHTPYWERFIADEAPLRYHSLGGQLYQVVGSLAFSAIASGDFVVGMGLSLGYSRLELDFARDTALEAGSDDVRGIASDCGGVPCGLENDLATQTYHLDVATDGIGGLFASKNLGLSGSMAVQVVKGWWIALGYVSPPGSFFQLDLGGDATVVAAPRDGGQTLRGQSEITFQMPQTVTLGVRGPILPGFELIAGGRWQNYAQQELFDVRLLGGEFADADVPEWYPRSRGLSDVWRVEAGLERDEQSAFRFGGRARVETGAVSSETVSPLQVEGLNLGLSAAGQLRIGQVAVVTLGYDISFFPSIDSDRSAFDPRDRLACVDTNFDFDSCEAARQGRALPTATGTYGRLQQSFILSFRYDNL